MKIKLIILTLLTTLHGCAVTGASLLRNEDGTWTAGAVVRPVTPSTK